jgi:hypothetical protein
MNAPNLTIPTVAEIDRRIDECRRELAALRKLRRTAQAAEQADLARRSRPPVSDTRTRASHCRPFRGEGDRAS